MAFSICPTIIINGVQRTAVRLVEIWPESDRHYPYRAEVTYSDGRAVRYRCTSVTIPDRAANGLLDEPQYELVGAVEASPILYDTPATIRREPGMVVLGGYNAPEGPG